MIYLKSAKEWLRVRKSVCVCFKSVCVKKKTKEKKIADNFFCCYNEVDIYINNKIICQILFILLVSQEK